MKWFTKGVKKSRGMCKRSDYIPINGSKREAKQSKMLVNILLLAAELVGGRTSSYRQSGTNAILTGDGER